MLDLLLSPAGRLDRRGFLILGGGLFVTSLLVQLVPVIGPIAALVLMWPWTVISIRRLHDMGRSGTLAVALMATSGAILGVSAVGAAMAATGALASLALFALVGVAAAPVMLASLAFLVWLAVAPSEAGANRFGAPAVPLTLG